MLLAEMCIVKNGPGKLQGFVGDFFTLNHAGAVHLDKSQDGSAAE